MKVVVRFWSQLVDVPNDFLRLPNATKAVILCGMEDVNPIPRYSDIRAATPEELETGTDIFPEDI
jgi:hypothetical protein